MKTIMGYFKVLLVCTLAMGISSCESEDEDRAISDYLINQTWVGDLGFEDRYGDALESGLYFKPNGLGIDDQVYFDDPAEEVVFSLPFRWEVYGGVLTINYGIDYPLFEIYDIYISRDRLSGILYVDGKRDGPIVLTLY